PRLERRHATRHPMNGSLNAIVPMACVTAAGIAAIVAEAFREPGERMPIGGLGAVGLIGAAIASLLLWGRDATSFGVVAADTSALSVPGILTVVGLLPIALWGPTIAREPPPGGDYSPLMFFSFPGLLLRAPAPVPPLFSPAPKVLSPGVYVLRGI